MVLPFFVLGRRLIWLVPWAFACGGEAIPPPPGGSLSIVVSSLPLGIVGQSYTARVKTSGAGGDVGPWRVTQGALPDGIELVSVGGSAAQLEGVPTAAGVFEFLVVAQDMSGDTATGFFTLTVDRAPPPLELQVLRRTRDIQVGEFYLLELEASGGAGTGYQWFVTELPPGLRSEYLGPRLTVLGQPAQGGRFEFDAIVQDPGGTQKVYAERAHLDYPPLRLVTDALPSGAVGVPYEARIRAAGGTGEGYTWSFSRSPPPGLSLDTQVPGPETRLWGVPQLEGPASFEAIVEDSNGHRASYEFEFEIVEGRPGVFFETDLLPNAFIGVPYSAPLRAVGGTPPYEFGFDPGAQLPSGIDLVQGTDGAELTGSPFESGLFKVHMWVRDANGSGSRRTLDLNVKTPPLRLDTQTLPDGRVGEEYRATLETVNTPEGGLRWYVSQGSLPRGLVLPDSGSPRNMVIGVPVESGDFEVTIAVTSAVDNSRFDLRSFKFRIEVP